MSQHSFYRYLDRLHSLPMDTLAYLQSNLSNGLPLCAFVDQLTNFIEQFRKNTARVFVGVLQITRVRNLRILDTYAHDYSRTPTDKIMGEACS